MPAARSAAAVVRPTRLWLGLVLFTYLTTRRWDAPLAIFVVPSAGRLAERLAVGGDRVRA